MYWNTPISELIDEKLTSWIVTLDVLKYEKYVKLVDGSFVE